MGWPAAYRRSAPVRGRGGFQPGTSPRRVLNPRSRANARTPLKDIENIFEQSAARLLEQAIERVLPGPVRGIIDLIDAARQAGLLGDIPFPGKAAAGKLNIYPGYEQCPEPLTCAGQPYMIQWRSDACSAGWPQCFGTPDYPLLEGNTETPRPSFILISADHKAIGMWHWASSDPLPSSPLGEWPWWQEGANNLPMEVPELDDYAPPWIDPGAAPINNPGIDWPASPYWIKPYIKPEPYPGSDPVPDPSGKPREQVAPSLSYQPGQRQIVTPGKNSFPRRPDKGVRERKAVAAVGGIVAKLVSGITEGRDFIKALWKALPADKRTKHPKLQDMLWDLYKNWRSLDIEEAVWNVIKDQLQDAFYGRVGTAYKRAAQRLNRAGMYDRPVGFQHGDRFRPRVGVKDNPYDIPDWIGEHLPHHKLGDFVRL